MSVPETIPQIASSDEKHSELSTILVPPIPTPVDLASAIRPESLRGQSTETDIDFQPLAANCLRMEQRQWKILAAIVGAGLGLAWVITGLVIRQSFDAWQWLVLVPIGMVIAILVWAAMFFPRRCFEATTWRSFPHGFEIRRGIWWRHRIFIPKDRIQHTDVHQGPMQRGYGLASLVLNTGGTHEPAITLEGLDMQVAERLREQLSLPISQDTTARKTMERI